MGSIIYKLALSFITFFIQGLCQATPHTPLHGNIDSPVRQVWQFPNETWIENLVVMRNGSILATEMTRPNLWLVDPFAPAATLVHEFPGYLGLLGITVIAPDIYAVVSGNFSLVEGKSIPGTYSVWKADFTSETAVISKIADIPEASFLNGMDYLGPEENAVLISDSTLGSVFRLDLSTGNSCVAIDDPLMKKCSPEVLEGINGMKIHGGYVYFTNAYCGFFARIPITTSGSLSGPSEILAYTDDPLKYIFDDFDFDEEGAAYVAQGNENIVTKISPPFKNPKGLWRTLDIAGNLNSTQIAEPTATRLWRTKEGREVLYISTGGAIGDPVDGNMIVGGQILALDIRNSTKSSLN